MNVVKKTFIYGNQKVTLETGEIARQSTGAVLVRMGDTVVLVTAVVAKDPSEGKDFFPLTVNYQERTYAAGKIPGGYFKREGRPTEKETLTSRLIDRPLRPLFPKGFKHEVQVIVTVLSVDNLTDPDIPSLLGASAALAVAKLPWVGPLGAARVGYQDGNYLLNPSDKQLEQSELDMVVAGTDSAVLMVESEAKQLSEDIMLGAVMFAHQQMQVAIKTIQEFAEEAAHPVWQWQPRDISDISLQWVKDHAEALLSDAYQIISKSERQNRLTAIRDELLTKFVENNDTITFSQEEVRIALEQIESEIVRHRILEGNPRIDGRDLTTVRPISIQIGILPRTHGSALFTRGETQALVVTTLGTERDAQTVEALGGEQKTNFMLHYNFPPYSVGEIGMLSGPKRREIGHGRLARRGIQAVLPSQDQFNYTIRLVSEITESNGSSSMASICGSSLALMDAGVPISTPVAGIAMGLVKKREKFAIISDILGDEDHLGDMDFKVAGTINGITALQMDIKIDGITEEIMRKALEQARQGRLHILDIMNQAINQPRNEMSQHAPRIFSMKIATDKIRDVIGKGGVTIRSIIEQTGVSIDIDDEGNVKIASVDSNSAEEAIKHIERITAEPEVGATYEGKVIKITDFGAFVSIMPGKDGLLHISQICSEHIKDVHEKLHEGQVVKVKLVEIDRQGRIRLSMKDIES